MRPVGLIADMDSGKGIADLAERMPVWVIDSPTNEVAVKALRERLPQGWITVFYLKSTSGVNSSLGSILYSIDEHQGAASKDDPYDTLTVVGAKPEEVGVDVLKELGFVHVSVTQEGFVASKH